MPFMAEYNLEPLGKRDPGKSISTILMEEHRLNIERSSNDPKFITET